MFDGDLTLINFRIESFVAYSTTWQQIHSHSPFSCTATSSSLPLLCYVVDYVYPGAIPSAPIDRPDRRRRQSEIGGVQSGFIIELVLSY